MIKLCFMLLNQLWQTDNELQDTNKHKDHKIHKVLLASTKKFKHGYQQVIRLDRKLLK